LAREFLEAFARGEACDPRPLALAVLAEPAPALAAKVLSGGPHEVQQARELAAVINGSNGSASGEAAPVKRSPRRRT
jgi:hypothetical protein